MSLLTSSHPKFLRTLDFHMDFHGRIPRVNMQKKTPRNIKTVPKYKNLPSRHVVFACRRPHLHRFWHVDGHRRHFGMSTGTFWHVDGRSDVVFWHVHGHTSFWHVDGRILHVDGHIYYFTLDYFSFPAYFLASRARHFGTSTGAFCMSTGTSTILHFTVFPFQVC